MKTVFDQATRAELINRINQLDQNNMAKWGKMNVYQMLKHCRRWEEMALGKRQYKQGFIGRLFGKMAMRNLLKDEKPLSRNTPTIADLKITGDGDITAEKKKWIELIDSYSSFSNDAFLHPFFGKMNREQTGWMAYKHSDHHLRQFNV